MYVQPVPLSPNTSPWAIASGSTATAAIGQIVAMKVVDVHVAAEVPRRRDVGRPAAASRSRRRRCPPATRRRPAGALNSTSATPPNASSANTSARGSMYSRKSQAPTGTIRNGASDPISAAFATLLCVAPAKKTARFRPKKTPGTTPGARRAA